MAEPLSLKDFTARFKARMLAVAGPTFDDGDSIAEYAEQTAPTYFETDWQRDEGQREAGTGSSEIADQAQLILAAAQPFKVHST